MLLFLLLLQGKGDLTHAGNQWAWSETGEAFVPQLVMYATPPHFYLNPAKVDGDIDTFLASAAAFAGAGDDAPTPTAGT